MIRTYQLKHQANKSKQTEIKAILDEYRVLASKIAVRQWYLFFTKGGFNKNADIKTISTGLSERYKQTCQYQVVGSLESFISNRKNDFVDRVCHSSLDERTKIDLLYINKHG
ncbi:MAG: RNA-guided endonuclease TnpB family protein, partial [Bacillota bacterium]